MGFLTLYRAKSLGPGADLWVLPNNESSEAALKIDWYLNFQMARSQYHQGHQLSPDLKKLIEDLKLKLPQPEIQENAPLMIAASQSFPCEMVVRLPFSKEKEWVRSVEKVWTELGRPRLRVFLPKTETTEGFQKHWHTPLEANDEISLVPA